MSILRRLIVLLTLPVLLHTACMAQAIERLWYNQEKTAKIKVYKAKDNKYYGKIVWLKEPAENGKPKVDDDNPDPAKRNQPLMGLVVLKDFKYEGDNVYTGGTIYDPKNGKTYSCKMTLKGDKLDVRGYVGISLLGRTAVWTVAD